MSFPATFFNFHESAVWYVHLRIPQARAQPLLDGPGGRRVWCAIDDTPAFQCALMPVGDGDSFININKELREKYGWQEGDTVRVTLQPDTSEYGMPVPEEFTALLSEDPEGSDLFHALTKGKQRALLYQIAKPKRAATRLDRAVGIFEYLKHANGKLDFKALNTYLKERRQGLG